MNVSYTSILLIVVCLLLLVGVAGVKPAPARTVNACAAVKLPVKKPCETTTKVIHGFTVIVKVCK